MFLEVKELAKELIKFESDEANRKGIDDCFLFVENWLSNAGIEWQEIEFAGSRPEGKKTILAFLEKEPEIILCGHLDVIPANKGQFQPFEKDGRLYGRGSCDMKSSIAVFLETMRGLKNKGRHSLGLVLTTDEEIGGERCAKHLVQDLGLKCKFAIVGEPTGLDVAVKEKPVLQFKVIARGKAAHGSRPFEGENAIDLLFAKVESLKREFNNASAEDFWESTLNLGFLKGGEVPNKVPDYAEALIDIRFTEANKREKIIESVKREFPESELVLEVAMMKTDPQNSFVKRLEECRKEVTGKSSCNDYSRVYSDARYFTNSGIPAVSFGPLGDGAHGGNESVDLKSLEEYGKILEKFLEDF